MEKVKRRYQIVHGQYASNLQEMVENNMTDGWLPIGGPCVFQGTWYQAMQRVDVAVQSEPTVDLPNAKDVLDSCQIKMKEIVLDSVDRVFKQIFNT